MDNPVRDNLPVWRTIVAAYGFLFRNWREALRIGWLPLVATVAYAFLTDYLPSGDGLPRLAFELYELGIWMAYAPVAAMVAVPWHRYVLLGQRTRDGALAVAFSARESRYVVLTVAITAVVVGSSWAAWLVPHLSGSFSESESVSLLEVATIVVYLAVYFLSWYVFALLCLALPASAVDRSGGFRGAVRLGYRNGWRVAFTTLAALAPFHAYNWGAGYVPGSALEGFWGLFAWNFAYGFLAVFEVLLVATMFSYCYRALGGLGTGQPGSTVIPPSDQT